MSPAMVTDNDYQKGVKHMHDKGIGHVPTKYVWPASERPNPKSGGAAATLHLPVIDFNELHGPDRPRVLKSLAHACQNYGFFQLVNHSIGEEIINSMANVSKRFFEMPMSEREKYMTADMTSLVRYGTSFNQTHDGVFCWRDFLKLVAHPLPDVLPHWPSSPLPFREVGGTYAKETRKLFVKVAEAILESLGVEDNGILKELEMDGSQMMVMNCYPPCPEPELTLGMPPHSDYGFLTLLLQDDVTGLQIQHNGEWITVQPIPGSFVVNVGDHLEILSNGRFKSVLHRVVVNSVKCRVSVASLHSVPMAAIVRPFPHLISQTNPRRYKDTDFASFLNYLQTCQSNNKNFLESRKLII